MRGSSLGLFIIVLVVIMSVADGARKCYVCGSRKDPCNSPKVEDCPRALRGFRKKRDADVSCTSVYNKDGSVMVKRCAAIQHDEKCEDIDGIKDCYCNSDLCNGSSPPKSISMWGLGLVTLFVVLYSSKLF